MSARLSAVKEERAGVRVLQHDAPHVPCSFLGRCSDKHIAPAEGLYNLPGIRYHVLCGRFWNLLQVIFVVFGEDRLRNRLAIGHPPAKFVVVKFSLLFWRK